MPRKPKSAAPQVDPNNLIDLGEDLEAVREEIATAPILTEETVPPSPVKKDKVPAPLDTEETDRKRKELLILASDGEIQKSVAQINKASAKAIDKIYAEHEAKRLEKAIDR